MFWIQMSEQHPLKYPDAYEPSMTYEQISMNDRAGGVGGVLCAQGGQAESEAGSPYWHQCLTGDQALLWRSSRACAERQCAELQTAQTLQLQRPKDNFCTQTNPNFIQINEQLSFGYQ